MAILHHHPWIRRRAGILLLACGMVAAGQAHSHDAPSGWSYPLECCDDRDCSQIDPGEVTVGDGYYVWKQHRIAFSSPRVRFSPDAFFHGCEAPHWGDTSGRLELVCFFVPAGL